MYIFAIVLTVVFFIGVSYYFLATGSKAREKERAQTTEQEIVKLKQRITNVASMSVDEKVALADECVKWGMNVEAIPLYSGCLTGSDENNPQIRFSLAKALHATQAYNETRIVLIQLQSDRTSYKPNQIRFLTAKNSEALGELDNALYEYSQLADILIGEEARWRHGSLLKKMGKKEEAHKVFKTILDHANQGDSYYRDEQKEWIQLAKENLN